MFIDGKDSKETERIRLPLSPLDGKAGTDAPGEREIRRREYSEYSYENTPKKV